MKKMITITSTILMIMVIFSASTATAGSARKHTIEGFMIGTGVALLSTAIIHEINKGKEPQSVYNRSYPGRYGHPGYKQHKSYYKSGNNRRYAGRERGHWEYERFWVGPVYEKKWNPGHYNKKGKWINGRYEKFVVKQGYWSEKKVWVRH